MDAVQAPSTRHTGLVGFVGTIDLASREMQVQRTAELMGRGALVVSVPPLPASMRGRLAQHLDEYIESELALRGSPSPWLADWSEMPRDAAARLADQLFRARTLGSSGVVICLGRISADGCAISPEDSLTLILLAQTTQVAPLVVMLDDRDGEARGYRESVGIRELVAVAPVAPCEQDETETETEPVEAAAVEEPLLVAEEVVEEEEPTIPEPVRMPSKPVAARVQVIAEARHTSGRGWRAAADSLGSIRGPLPLSAFEKYFVEAYVPLTAAIEEGLEDARALQAHEDFKCAFEHAYTEAFATFGATTRRPRLVMDLYDFAAKQARLHNARSSHVLLVDSMRWDLGLMFRDTFTAATLTAETLMFSSLPTTTLRQLETLARGIDALRDPQSGEILDSLRGRSADTVRRLRVGSRELFKLDTIPAMLETAADFEEMMEHVVAAVTRHTETLAPRTLLLVAGDHGFTLDKNGISAHGGASPEEVLVPALAYLVGDLH